MIDIVQAEAYYCGKQERRHMKIEIDTEDIQRMARQGEEIVFEAEAEDALFQLLQLKKRVEDALEDAKQRIEASALEYNPNFTSVQGDKVKVGYQYSGQKYKLDESSLETLPEDMYKVETKYSPVSQAIDKFYKDNKELPIGVIECERTPKVVIKPLADLEESESERQ